MQQVFQGRSLIGVLQLILLGLPPLILSFDVNAQVYRCVMDGKTQYSDEPCGADAELVDVSEAQKPTGANLQNPDLKAMGEELSDDRRQRELQKAIADQHKKIERLSKNYDRTRTRLQDQLDNLENKSQYRNWRANDDRRKKYKQKRRELRNEKKSVERRYKGDKEAAYLKLRQLEKEERRLEREIIRKNR